MKPSADPNRAVVVAVKCAQCGRFWFNLSGTKDGLLKHVDGHPGLSFKFKILPNGEPELDVRACETGVRVSPFAGPDRDEKPMSIMGSEFTRKQYKRYQVICHPRCGRNQSFRAGTLGVRFFQCAGSSGDTLL